MKQFNWKKITPIALAVIVIAGGIVAFTKLRNTKPQPDQESKKQRIQQPVNVIDISQRPYLKVIPEADGHNITIEIDQLKKPASSVNYELEYQAGSLLQGAFGEIELTQLPARKEILLGSCSAGGACTYHEDVQGGTLLTQFEDNDDPYALKSRWKYIDNSDGETAHSSQDAMFQIESDQLASQSYIVIFNTAGYPEGLEGTPVSELYSLTTSSKLSGTAQLTIRAAEEGELTIKGYDGSEWHAFDTSVDGKMASAEVDLMELYVVVK